MLPSHAAALADRYGVGPATGLVGPVAKGRVGEIWRLDTDRGAYAVKTWREPPDPAEVAADTELQEHFAAAGIPMPVLVRTTDGDVLAQVDGTPVRLHTWVDVLDEDRGLDPAAVGALLARLHRVRIPADGPIDDWFVAPVGEQWSPLVADLRAGGAPFADRLASLVPAVREAEQLLTHPTYVQVCHRDLWADNLRATPSGGLMVLDWELAGPADPAQELAMVAFEYSIGDLGRVRTLFDAYVDAGGPGRLREPGDFTMLLATQGNIVRIGCRRWLAATTDEERADNEAWVAEFLDDPVLMPTVEAMLDAVG